MGINQKLQEDDPLDFGGQSKLMAWASSIMLTLLFLVVLGCVVIWVVVHPKNLEYTVEYATVINFNITTSTGTFINKANVTKNFDLTAFLQNKSVNGSLMADFYFRMLVYNPNHRVSFGFGLMQADVFRGDQSLASTKVTDEYWLNRTDYVTFHVSPSARNVTLQWSTSKDLVLEKRGGLYINVDMTLKTYVNFTARHWKSERRKIEIYCANVTVNFHFFSPDDEYDAKTNCTVAAL